TDPTRQGVDVYEGNTVNNALSVPVVTYGDNRTLGTLRVTGKQGIVVPVRPGNQVKVELPVGLCYMQVPTENTYISYVEYPDKIDSLKNQIRDADGKLGLEFIAGSARSITVRVDNVDSSGQIMAIDFIFNKSAVSTVRVNPLMEAAESYIKDPSGKVTRLQFLRLLADVTAKLDPGLFDYKADEKDIREMFSDTASISSGDRGKLQLLVNSRLIVGYPDKTLRPDEYLTRAEALSLLVRTIQLPSATGSCSFKDPIPAWAVRDINSAVGSAIIAGDENGCFRANQPITKAEVLSIMQRTIETYKAKI
ncbi:MAG: S-layer homology domain-containing protein, partial [Ignavibacteriales bacterium]